MPKTAKTATQWNKMVGVRLEPRLQYLAELGAKAKQFKTLTEYIKWALEESFKQVSLSEPPQPYETATGEWKMPTTQDPKDDLKTVGNLSNLLWDESEYVRILMLSMLAPHRQASEDEELLKFVHSRKDLWKKKDDGRAPDREKINAQWESIKADFAKSRKGK